MIEILQNLYCLSVKNDFLIYSPLNRISALLNGPGLAELKKQLELLKSNRGDSNSKLYELACDIINSPSNEVSRRRGAFDPEFLGIIPTRACNGACNYCDFGVNRSSHEKMSYELAVQSVDWYINKSIELKRNIVEIHFFGGEPMLAQDVIEVAIHRARMMASKNKLIPYFEISTNGQYDKNTATWIGNYFNMVVLSFDGLEYVQNIHRPLPDNKDSFWNAYNTATIISESNADLSIRSCVSQLNVEQMCEITHWFCQNFRISALNFEILCATELTKEKGLIPPDPIEFAIEYQKAKEIAKGYGVEVVYASDISQQLQVSSCPVGRDTAIVSMDGRISSCYLMPERWQTVDLDLDFGFLKSAKDVHLNKKSLQRIRNIVEQKPRCDTCFCKWSCSGGCHVGNTYPGCTESYDDFCLQTRIISAFTLLNNLGMQERIDKMLESPQELKKMASTVTDLIFDFNNES